MPITNTLAHGVPFLDFAQDAPRLVQHFRHALSLNEQRPHFMPTSWTTPAHATNHGASYLEAWFFGFHADIGGGSRERGLSLWPLQWMLACATELGLTLAAPADDLFPSPAHIVELPQQPKMTMHDLLPRLAASPYRPVLHAASPRQQLVPRDYRSTLTPASAAPAAVRVFLHPSTYLLFNTLAAFRLQVYPWRLFRQFAQDHGRALPRGAPWWEPQTEAAMLHEVVPVRELRLLVYGAARAGKTALLEAAFGRFDTRRGGDDGGIAYHPGGLVACETDTVQRAERYVAEHIQKTEAEEKLHAIW